MNILDAYDLTGSLRDAGELAGCSHPRSSTMWSAVLPAASWTGPQPGRS